MKVMLRGLFCFFLCMSLLCFFPARMMPLLFAASEPRLDRLDMFYRDHPGYPNETYALGKKYYDKRQFDKAEFYFKQTLRDNPDHVDARLYLSYIYLWQGHLAEALSGFEAVLQRAPGYEDALEGMEKARKLQDSPSSSTPQQEEKQIS